CLARAVGPDEREELSRPDGEVDVAQGGEAAEANRQPRDVEQRGGLCHGSDLIQSESGLKCPFSTRTQKPCFCVSWSGPIVMGGTMPVSNLLSLSRPVMSPSRVRFRPARLAPSAKRMPARYPASE